MPDALSFTLDHGQRRLRRDQLNTLIHGGYDRNVETNKPVAGWAGFGLVDANGDQSLFVDRVTATLMFRPVPMLKAWQTNGSGIYARLKKADYTLITGSKWLEHNFNGNSSVALKAQDLHEKVVTSTAWPKNRPFYLSWFIGQNFSDRNVLELGWSNTGDKTAGVALRVFPDGTVEVYKSGVKIGGGNVGGTKSEKTAKTGWLDLFIIPMPKRDLLVISREGEGFVHSFADIDEFDTDPTITPAEKFWWYVAEGEVQVECAPLRFLSTGWRTGIVTVFIEPPPAGVVPSFTIFKDLPGYGPAFTLAAKLVTAAVADLGDVDFAPDGVERECRVRVDFSGGDGESTPFVRGVLGQFPGETILTDSAEALVLDQWVTAARLEVPESPSSVRLELDMRRPDEIDPEGNAKLKVVSNRPLKVSLGTVTVLDGVTEPLSWWEAIDDKARKIAVGVRDRWKALENYRFTDTIPLDGLRLKKAFEDVAASAGFDSTELDVEDAPVTLPTGSTQGHGDWCVQIEVGDTAAEWIQRLHEDYAGTWFLGIVPTANGPVLRFRSPEDLGDIAVFTLYDNVAEAIQKLTDEGQTSAEARRLCYQRTYRSFRESVLEPEANVVHVTGLDRRTWRPIHSIRYDSPEKKSHDPTLPPSLRPENWLGEIRKYAWVDYALATQTETDRAAELLARRLTPVRFMAEWEAELMIDPATGVPLWRGDVVTLDGKGDYRIVSLSLTIEKEPATGDNWQWRPVRYVGERLVADTAKGCGSNLPGTSLAEMERLHALRLHSKFYVREGQRDMLQRPPLSVSEVP